jgi:rsbT co-antagonist protein RsbR
MPQTQVTIESLQGEIAALRQEIAALQREKIDLELLLEMTAEHSDGVTEHLHREVEATQRESAERFEVLTDTVPVPIFVSQVEDDVIVYANRSAGELTGVARTALLGRSVSEFYSDAGERERILAAVEERGAVNHWELWGRRDDEGTFWAAAFVRPLPFDGKPCLLEAYHDLTVRKQAEQERERFQQERIEAQGQAIQELSTPIIPVMNRIIVMPLIGAIDTMRARDITRRLLVGISAHQARFVILDITGVPIVDSSVADYLNKSIQAARLKGARVVVTGISEAVAETIVDLGIDWSGIETVSDLQMGLVAALNRLGVTLTSL